MWRNTKCFFFSCCRSLEKLADRRMEMENTQGGIWIVNEIWHLEIRTKTRRCACRWNSAMQLVSRRRFVVPDIPMKVGEQLSENFIQIWGLLNGEKASEVGQISQWRHLSALFLHNHQLSTKRSNCCTGRKQSLYLQPWLFFLAI